MKKATTKTASTKGKSSVAKNAATKPKSRSKTKKSSKKSDKDIIQIHVWDIKLTKDSKKRLRKVKNTLWRNAANAIEWGNWYIPVKNYHKKKKKKSLEDGMRDFFSIDKDIPVEIEDFMTNIIEYDNHR